MTAASVPAPVGGWNARDSLDDMDANDAVSMINMIPRAGFVESRRGCSHYTELGESILPNGITTLIPYQNSKLLAAYDNDLWDITDPLVPNALSAPSLSGKPVQWTAFQDLVILTTGADTAMTYNGGSAVTLCVFTGHAGNFWGVNTFKGRAFYWEKDSRSFWYAQAGAYQGVMTEFDLSTQTRTGGTLVQMLTITRDAGDGVDDFAVFVFSTGEAIVYQGDDPQDPLRWSSSGRFQIGEPLGIRAHYKVGGTEIILTKDGWLDIATALSGGRLSEASTYSDKIIREAKDVAGKYAHLFGWECLYYPAGNLFIVNVPRSGFETENGSGWWAIQSEQHVRNTSTGAWCKFSGWHATTFAVWKDKLYFAQGAQVYLADVANDDAGQPISMECIPAFNYLGSRGHKKQITMANHITNYQKPEYLVKDGMADFNVQFVNEVPFAPYTGAAKWGLSKWNVARWALGSQFLTNTTEGWQNVSAMGYAVTVSLRIITQGSPFVWYGSNYIYRRAGDR